MLNIVIKSLWETIFLQHRQYIQLIYLIIHYDYKYSKLQFRKI